MKEPLRQKSVWYLTGAMLMVAGLIGGIATYLWWLPCRGQMMLGSYWYGWYDEKGFTEACLQQMDGGAAFPLPSPTTPVIVVLSTITVALCGIAWLRVAIGADDPRTRLILLTPGAGVLLVAVLGWLSAHELVGTGVMLWVLFGVGVAIIPAWVVLAQQLWLGPNLPLVRWSFALLALVPYSLFGVFLDVGVMSRWSEANWDTAPGGGYPSAAWILVCGLVVLLSTGLARPGRDDVSKIRHTTARIEA